MELKDITDRLTEEQKKRLAEVKTEDDLKKLLLEDEELNEIAGGWDKELIAADGCYRTVREYIRIKFGDTIDPKTTE